MHTEKFEVRLSMTGLDPGDLLSICDVLLLLSGFEATHPLYGARVEPSFVSPAQSVVAGYGGGDWIVAP